MGDGTGNSPYTREDVLRLIKENGDKAEGLDLSEKYFEDRIDLKELSLWGIILNGAILQRAHLEGANLINAHLEGAILINAHLERAILWKAHSEGAILINAHLEGADLLDAHFERANLTSAHLEGAGLESAHLEGAILQGATFSPDAKMEDADWGNYILGEERAGRYADASHTYRRLKQWYTSAGMYDVAGEFYYREMEAKRKALKWLPNPCSKFWQTFVRLLCGYGEKWERVIASAVVVILSSALVYYKIGTLTPNTLLDCLYFSAISFSALGYGGWAPEPTGWVKGLGVAETFIGVFMTGLFLVTFTRKMTR